MPRYTGSPAAVYKAWHWGLPHGKVVKVEDKYLGEKKLIEIGKLLEIHIRPLDSTDEKDVAVLAVEPAYVKRSHVVFDLRHPKQRIWIVLPPEAQKDAAELWGMTDEPAVSLVSLAQAVGSVHGTRDYPAVSVKPLGWLQDLVYGTYKNGDDAELVSGKIVGVGSGYIHRMGEEGGVEPILAVSKEGRLWLAGGSYTAPIPGITR